MAFSSDAKEYKISCSTLEALETLQGFFTSMNIPANIFIDAYLNAKGAPEIDIAFNELYEYFSQYANRLSKKPLTMSPLLADAKAVYPERQHVVRGMQYAFGIGVEKNHENAKRHFNAALELNDIRGEAHCMLGYMAFLNNNIYDEIACYSRGAALLNSFSINMLGSIYFYGAPEYGIHANQQAGLSLFYAAAQLDNLDAICNLIKLHLEDAVKIQIDKSVSCSDYYKQSAMCGSTSSIFNLAVYYENKGNPELAACYYRALLLVTNALPAATRLKELNTANDLPADALYHSGIALNDFAILTKAFEKNAEKVLLLFSTDVSKKISPSWQQQTRAVMRNFIRWQNGQHTFAQLGIIEQWLKEYSGSHFRRLEGRRPLPITVPNAKSPPGGLCFN